MWTRLTTILDRRRRDRGKDAVHESAVYSESARLVCKYIHNIAVREWASSTLSRWIELKGVVKWGADGRGRARALRASERRRGGSPRDRGSKNARLRAQPLCLFRRVVARRCGGGRSEPRGGHQGSASGPWRSSGKLHPLSRPLNPRAVRLVRVRLPRSTVRPSIYSNVHSFVCSAYCSLSHRIFRCIVSYRLLPTAVANESDACKWYLHGFPLFLPPELLAVPTPDYRRSTAVFHPRGKRRSQRRVLLDVRLRDLSFWIFRDRFSGWWIVLVRGQRESFLHMVSTLWT